MARLTSVLLISLFILLTHASFSDARKMQTQKKASLRGIITLGAITKGPRLSSSSSSSERVHGADISGRLFDHISTRERILQESVPSPGAGH
ncbi:hypothetical protein L6164_018339 [Bauhinia variegata]|uniref:Uncharacterized protein n=1 Tax=Bauhinia variegata TaxID=167791 RepID=A0ACB9NAW9_BAUVA|nr:hypothetical protein L6164_018339 [Bauhinia variegata]